MKTFFLIFGIFLVGLAVLVLLLWIKNGCPKETKGVVAIIIPFAAFLGGAFIGVSTSIEPYCTEFKASEYYLDYKVVTTQVNSTTILRDTTYVLTQK